jgi:hypothetical protein
MGMITLRDRQTGDLFDRWSELGEKRRRLLDRSWGGVFRDHLFYDLPVDELLPHFAERMGRPSVVSRRWWKFEGGVISG